MIRLIGLIAVLAFAIIAVIVVLAIILAPSASLAEQGEEKLPASVRIVAFVVLMLVLLGLSLGWIGGL